MTERETREKREAIHVFVRETRERLGITTLDGPLPELSCFLHGEFHNLLWRGLIPTREVRWGELGINDPDILEGLYQEIQRHEHRAA